MSNVSKFVFVLSFITLSGCFGLVTDPSNSLSVTFVPADDGDTLGATVNDVQLACTSDDGEVEFTLGPKATETDDNNQVVRFGADHGDDQAEPGRCELTYTVPDGWEQISDRNRLVRIRDVTPTTEIVDLRRIESNLSTLIETLNQCLEEPTVGLEVETNRLLTSVTEFEGGTADEDQVLDNIGTTRSRLDTCRGDYDNLKSALNAADDNDPEADAARLAIEAAEGAFEAAEQAIEAARAALGLDVALPETNISGRTDLLVDAVATLVGAVGNLANANENLDLGGPLCDATQEQNVRNYYTTTNAAMNTVIQFKTLLATSLEDVSDAHPDRAAAEAAIASADQAIADATDEMARADNYLSVCFQYEVVANTPDGDQARVQIVARDENGVLLSNVDVSIPLSGGEEIVQDNCANPCEVNYDLSLGTVDVVVEAAGFASKLFEHTAEDTQVDVVNLTFFPEATNGELFAPFGSIRLDLDTSFDLAGNGLVVKQSQDGAAVQVPATCAISDGDTATATVTADCSAITTGSAGCVRFTATYDQFDADGDGVGDEATVDFYVRVSDGPDGSPQTCF